MFIKVRYGNDELILCNPQCSVNNLLDSIMARCGIKNSGRILDLSDETGIFIAGWFMTSRSILIATVVQK